MRVHERTSVLDPRPMGPKALRRDRRMAVPLAGRRPRRIR